MEMWVAVIVVKQSEWRWSFLIFPQAHGHRDGFPIRPMSCQPPGYLLRTSWQQETGGAALSSFPTAVHSSLGSQYSRCVLITIDFMKGEVSQYYADVTEDKPIIYFSITNQPPKDQWPGFPGGSAVKNPPADAGDRGSIPHPGRSHVSRHNWACVLQLLGLSSRAGELQPLNPHA